jgi:hypothetical protein
MRAISQMAIEGCRNRTFSGTNAEDGERMEVDGCDVFSFRDGLIAVKNTYMKS